MILDAKVAEVREGMSADEQLIFDRLVVVAEQVNPALQNSFRWKVPTFTLDNNWHHWLFSINPTKAGVTLTFHKGWLLDDPKGLLKGDGKHLRLLRFKSAAEIDEDAVARLMHGAIRHQTDL